MLHAKGLLCFQEGFFYPSEKFGDYPVLVSHCCGCDLQYPIKELLYEDGCEHDADNGVGEVGLAPGSHQEDDHKTSHSQKETSRLRKGSRGQVGGGKEEGERRE